MKYHIERTSQFKIDFKLAEKQGLDMEKLAKVISLLPHNLRHSRQCNRRTHQ